MLTVETASRIQREHFVKGKKIKEISRDLKVSRNTVGAAKQMLLQRCELVEDSEGQFRSNRDTSPAAAKAAQEMIA